MNNILTKKDCKTCQAKLKAMRVFFNSDSTEYYQGKVSYYEKGIHLFTETASTIRLHEHDAIKDAEVLAQANNF